MALTEFGKAVRKARIDGGTTLAAMSESLGVSPSYLSALETGRKKIPMEWVAKITEYFSANGVEVKNLKECADVSNKSVSLEGMSLDMQMLVAGFARSDLDADTYRKLAELLGAEKGDTK